MTFCLNTKIISPEKNISINNAVILLHGYGGDGNDIIDGSQANLTPGLSGVRYEGYFNDKFEFFEQTSFF